MTVTFASFSFAARWVVLTLWPLPLLLLWRAFALREAGDPKRYAWFRYQQRQAATMSFGLLLMVLALILSWPENISMSGPVGDIFLGYARYVAVLGAIVLLVSSISADVERRVRGVRRRVSREMLKLVPTFFLIASSLGGTLLLIYGVFRHSALFGSGGAVLVAAGVFAMFWLAGHPLGRPLEQLASGRDRSRILSLGYLAGYPLHSVCVYADDGVRPDLRLGVTSGSVRIGQGLLRELPPNELDALIAQALCAARSRNEGLAARALVPGLVTGLSFAAPIPARYITFSAATAFGMLWSTWHSLRRARRADREAVALTHDPAALISAISRFSRLQGEPPDWNPAWRWLTSTDSPRRRAVRIVRDSGLPNGSAERLLQVDAAVPT